jgi:uncharacterized protein YjbI with pentapeptide repeats
MREAWRRYRDWLDSLQPSWLRWIAILASAAAAVLVMGGAIAVIGTVLYGWSPTGFGASTTRTTTVTTGNVVDTYETRPGKTLWDWMGLLLVPLVLAVGALVFNWQQRKAEQERLQKRDKTERELALDQQRENALQTYLDCMTDLLLKEGLRTSEKADVRDVARARTLMVLRGLDAKRKAVVVQFLKESDLITLENAVINLRGADLTHAKLIGADLDGANLSEADLSWADLVGATLTGANLTKARLAEADLVSAYLPKANLYEADLHGAKLHRANLENASLAYAILNGAELNGANLTETDITEADLTEADLTEAEVDYERLARAKSLKGATMPDGRKAASRRG